MTTLNGDYINAYKIEDGVPVIRYKKPEEKHIEDGVRARSSVEEKDCSGITCGMEGEEAVVTARRKGSGSGWFEFEEEDDWFSGSGDNRVDWDYDSGGGNYNANDGSNGEDVAEEETQACSGNKVYNPSTKTCECPEGMVDNGYECVVAVEVINKLTGKAKCVYDKMVDGNNNINWILNNFNDGNKSSQFNLRFEMSTTLGNETNASFATPQQSGIANAFVIRINENRAENINTTLTIARTIIHEGIHARLWEFAYRNGGKVNSIDFPGVYDFMRRHKYNWDHQQMATFYRGTIAQGLKQFDNAQHTDEFYEAMAWEGLSEIKDKNGNQDKIYTEAWKKLSSSEQKKVLDTIKKYKQDGSKTCD